MISAFHVSYKTASKSSLIEKAAKKEREGSTLREREEKKQRENQHTVTNRQVTVTYINIVIGLET